MSVLFRFARVLFLCLLFGIVVQTDCMADNGMADMIMCMSPMTMDVRACTLANKRSLCAKSRTLRSISW